MDHIKNTLGWTQVGLILCYNLGWIKFSGTIAGLAFWSPLELFVTLWVIDAFLYIFLVDKGKHFKD